MSRKINSNLLKKNRSNKWSFNYVVKTKEEMSFFLFKNYVIYNVLKILLIKYQLLMLNCKLYKTNSLVHLYVSYLNIRKKKNFNCKNYPVENSLFINKIIKVLNEYTKNKLNFYLIIQNVKKYLIQLKTFFTYNWVKKRVVAKIKKFANKYNMLKTLLQIFFIVITKPNSAKLLSSYISYIFRFKAYKKDHLKFFKLFKTIIQTILNSKISIISGIKIILSGRINGFSRSRTRYFQHGNMPLNTFNVKIDYASNTAFTVNGTLGIKVWVFEKG
nr:ribosomal protein S3 [Actinocyclus sp. mgcode 4]